MNLETDDNALAWAADDFGHFVHGRPVGVLRPTSVADISAAVRFAAARGIPVTPRGQGHSTAGQAQAPGGIVIDMSRLNAVHDVGADHVVVDAGARWSEVLAATLPLGLTPPVLTDYLELSVGGTLSVGGVGGASHHHGAQTDNVLALDVVRPDGTVRTCSAPGRGIIVRATLRLVPAPTRAHTYRLRYTELGEFLDDQRLLVAQGRFDHVEGQAKPAPDGWSYVIDATSYADPPVVPDGPVEEVASRGYLEFADRMADDVALLRALGAWAHPHPWCNVFVPDHEAEAVVAEVLSAAEIGETGVVVIYPVPRAKFATLSLPDTTVAFLLALLRAASPDDPDALHRMIEQNQQVKRRVLALGGTSYLVER